MPYRAELPCKADHAVFRKGEAGAEDGKGNKGGNKHRAQRRNKKIQRRRDAAAEPPLQPGHEPDCNDHRDNVSLIPHLFYVETEQMPDRDVLRCTHRPRVEQRGVHHAQPHHPAEEKIAPKHPGGGERHQHRQRHKSCAGHHL